MIKSTPGGIDIGVRPSFEGLFDVFENWRRGAAVWKAGTRKAGSVTGALVPERALSSTFPLLGANIVDFGSLRCEVN